MKTNRDAFENDLSALRRRTLPAEWRGEMLQAAVQKPRGMRTPRWLLACWGLAWTATLAMHCTMPGEQEAAQASSPGEATPPRLWQERAAAIEALLAAK